MKIQTAPFRSWLIHRNYSASTIKNYLADINKFFNYIENRNLKIENSDDIFSVELISSYLSSLTDKLNYKRYLSSLKKFCQFALDQKVISSNPIKKVLNPTATNNTKPNQNQNSQLLTQFNLYLKKHHKSISTIRNYQVDIQQFLNWSP